MFDISEHSISARPPEVPTGVPRRTFLAGAVGASVLVNHRSVVGTGGLVPGITAEIADTTLRPFKVGAVSANWSWTDAALGPVGVYRSFDRGFSFATWQETKAYLAHPNATFHDYSIRILPQRLADPDDPIIPSLRAFLSTTPPDLVITNYHEPDDKHSNLFSPAQFRAGILALARLVRDQNEIDGGARRTSVILMAVTFGAYGTSVASDWWPTDTRDGGHVDIVTADVYSMPHATNTPGVPSGYTDGINWRKAPGLFAKVASFARAKNTAWAVSEHGYLEDLNDPTRKAKALADSVAYVRANGGEWISYFDAVGPRADWRLRWSSPVGTASMTSNATLAWRQQVAHSTV